MCTHRILIVGWWHSSTRTEAIVTLDSVTLILDANFSLNNNLIGPPDPPSEIPPGPYPPLVPAHALYPPPFASPPSPLAVVFTVQNQQQ